MKSATRKPRLKIMANKTGKAAASRRLRPSARSPPKRPVKKAARRPACRRPLCRRRPVRRRRRRPRTPAQKPVLDRACAARSRAGHRSQIRRLARPVLAPGSTARTASTSATSADWAPANFALTPLQTIERTASVYRLRRPDPANAARPGPRPTLAAGGTSALVKVGIGTGDGGDRGNIPEMYEAHFGVPAC